MATMPAKRTPAELVVSSPEWQVPSREQLEEIETGHVLNHVRKYHEGLRLIRVEVMDSDKQTKGTIQRFELSIGDDGSPIMAANHVAQLIRARGIRYAVDEDRKTQFRVWLNGKSSTTREWTQQFRFTVDPQITEDYQDAADDDEQENEDDGGDPEDDDDDEEDEEEGDDEGEEQDVEDDVRHATRIHAIPRPPTVGYGQRTPPQPPQPTHGEIRYPTAEARNLPPTHSLHPTVDIARAQGVDVKPENMQVQLNPDFMIALMNVGEERMARMISPLMKEMRLGMQTIRRESSRLAKESRMNARMVSRTAVMQQRESQKRQDKLEERFIRTCELNYSSYENFQLIAQQGWTAFRNSMEKESETYVRMREYDRALLGQQILTERSSDRTSATGSMLQYGAPIALTVGAGFMRKRGDEDTAKMMEKVALLLAPRGGDDDDEEEEGEEEVIDAQPTGNPTSQQQQQARPSSGANGAGQRWELSTMPAILGARAFLESLSPEQFKSLQETWPKSAWDAMLGAANAQIEQSAVASLAIVATMVGTDPAIQIATYNQIDPQQKTVLLKLFQIGAGAKPRGRGIPRRPQAAAAG